MQAPMSDHYALLGVGKHANQQEIKQAFRSRAREVHPDKGGDAAGFAALQAAAAVLLDPGQRAVYDQIAHHLPAQSLSAQPLHTRPGGRAEEVINTTPSLEDIWLDSDAEDEVEQPRAAQAGDEEGSKGWLEGALLDLLAARGVSCDAASQLVVTCEVCRRPATQTCWVCSCHVCELCTRTMHWKGSWGWHWPIVDQPGALAEKLGQKEFEAKRIEDAHEYERKQPGYVPAAQQQVARDFRDAVARVAALPGPKTQMYHPELARHYLWTQTPGALYLAVHLPEGREGSCEPEVTLQAGLLSVRSTPEDASSVGMYVIQRQLAGPVDSSLPMEVIRMSNNRYVVIVLAKAEVGTTWQSVFKGDGQGARRVAGRPEEQLYHLQQDQEEVVVEMQLPWWVGSADVECDITESSVCIKVKGLLHVIRTFWAPSKDSKPQLPVIIPSLSAWSLTSRSDRPDTSGAVTPAVGQVDQQLASTPRSTSQPVPARRPGKVLTLQLVKRQLTRDERQYKHGVRQDNLVVSRSDGNLGPAAVLQEDEDEWGLTALLQATVFQAACRVFIAPRPWEVGPGSTTRARWVTRAADLPADVARLLRPLATRTE